MPRQLWAPWRLDYLNSSGDGAAEAADPAPAGPGTDGCFLCEAAVEGGRAVEGEEQSKDDAEKLVLLRGKHTTLLLNRYPYTNGHLLAAPFDHVSDLSDLSDLSPDARHELMDFAELGNRLLRRAVHCQGVNVGMNLGRAAGAGVPGHVHLHVVPRWHGDTTFLDLVGQVRVIPEALTDSYDKLKAALAAMR